MPAFNPLRHIIEGFARQSMLLAMCAADIRNSLHGIESTFWVQFKKISATAAVGVHSQKLGEFFSPLHMGSAFAPFSLCQVHKIIRKNRGDGFRQLALRQPLGYYFAVQYRKARHESPLLLQSGLVSHANEHCRLE